MGCDDAMTTVLNRTLTPGEELLRSWQAAGREALSAAVVPASLNNSDRTIDVIWYTGVDVQRFDWISGKMYTRRFDPSGVDLSVLNSGAPVLDNHKLDSAADQVGVVQRAWVSGTNYLGTLRFSKRPAVDGLWIDIADGICSKYSMGVEIIDSEDSTEDDQLVKLATAWRPFEISLAPIPADFATTSLSRELIPPASDDDPAWLVNARARLAEIEALRSDPTPAAVLTYRSPEVHNCFAMSGKINPYQCRDCGVWTPSPHLQNTGRDERILCAMCCPCRGEK